MIRRMIQSESIMMRAHETATEGPVVVSHLQWFAAANIDAAAASTGAGLQGLSVRWHRSAAAGAVPGIVACAFLCACRETEVI